MVLFEEQKKETRKVANNDRPKLEISHLEGIDHKVPTISGKLYLQN